MLNKNHNPAIVIIGAQGSGKSTQTALVAKRFKLAVFESGDELRRLAAGIGSPAEELASKMNSGQLIDDQTVEFALEQFLIDKPMNSGLVLDGFPRNINQCRELARLAETRGWSIIGLYLEITDQVAVKRLLARHRPDDTDQVISERLRLFHQRTAPVLDWLKTNYQLLVINGEPAISTVSREVISRLDQLLADDG